MVISNIILAVALCVVTIREADALAVPPEFIFDLAKPPAERWAGAVDMIVKLHTWNYSYEPFFAKYYPLVKVLPPGAAETLEALIATRYPDEYAELKTIAADLQRHTTKYVFNTKVLCVFVYFYELTHAKDLGLHDDEFLCVPGSGCFEGCCGILSLPEDKSLPMIHGRNLDISPAAGRNMTMHITIVNGTYGKVFDAVGWGWTTAAFGTTCKTGALTMEWNWRVHGVYTLNQILAMVQRPGAIPAAYVQRILMMRPTTSFDDALQFLLWSNFSSPFYVTMTGSKRRGAILTLDPNPLKNDLEILDDNSSVTFVVQTNYDRWLPDPQNDPRRTVAENVLASVGRYRSGTELGVWMALSTYPVHNPNTFFSSISTVNSSVIEGYIRRAMMPVP